ncbi:hypothetical protein [Caulobacter sp. DWP3-1-3b2]|uniref:hypothetical protein n=1 Tax=Caulobacter sp. DWP3-1-3b2 TaxID=2804643 RepID=UPI003CF7B721
MIVVFFKPGVDAPASGRIRDCLEATAETVQAQGRPFVEVFEHRGDWSQTHEVVDGVVVPRAPVQMAAEALAAASRHLRVRRNTLLRDVVDPYVTNPLRWAELTEGEQAEMAAWRSALLDWPDTETDPENPTEPPAPDFVGTV